MSDQVLPLVGLGLVVLVCSLALWKGGRPERLGGGLLLIVWVAGAAAAILLPGETPPLLMLSLDAVLAVGFLALTIRFGVLWLGAALLLQSANFALHANYLGEMFDLRSDYIQIVNAISLLMLILLLGATLVAWRRRLVRRRLAAAPSVVGATFA